MLVLALFSPPSQFEGLAYRHDNILTLPTRNEDEKRHKNVDFSDRDETLLARAKLEIVLAQRGGK